MGRHATPAGPEGREARRRLQRERRRRHYPGGVWRYLTGGLAIAAASGYMESTNVPVYYHPVQAAFGALLPLAVIDAFGTFAANFLGERRARRLRPPRPRADYALLSLGWVVIGGACALLAWAAGARPTGPGVGEDWLATGLIWATVISGCAAVMTIGRALPSGTARRPAWLARTRAAQLENLIANANSRGERERRAPAQTPHRHHEQQGGRMGGHRGSFGSRGALFDPR